MQFLFGLLDESLCCKLIGKYVVVLVVANAGQIDAVVLMICENGDDAHLCILISDALFAKEGNILAVQLDMSLLLLLEEIIDLILVDMHNLRLFRCLKPFINGISFPDQMEKKFIKDFPC